MAPRPWLKSDPAPKNIYYRQQNQTKNKAAASEVPVPVPADTSEQGEGVGEKAAPGQGRDPSPCAASTPADPAESGRKVLLSGGRRWWRTGGVLSGGVPEQGGAAARRRPSGPGCPGDPAQAFGWMVGTESPAKIPTVRQDKGRSIPP